MVPADKTGIVIFLWLLCSITGRVTHIAYRCSLSQVTHAYRRVSDRTSSYAVISTTLNLLSCKGGSV